MSDYFDALKNLMVTLADQIDTNDLPADVILTRVEDLKEMFAEITSLQDTDIDKVVWNNLLEIELRIRRENGFNITTCGVGRPSLEVPLSAIVTYIQSGLSTSEIADLLGVSTSTIGRRMAQHGIRSYAQIGYIASYIYLQQGSSVL
ncbi:UNVERIFIED_CONTAM: hypothetical protein FKN15_074557 [Acipenser sinensis]